MKLLAVLSLLIACNISFAQQNGRQDIHSALKWLEGRWVREGMRDGSSTIEFWLFEKNKIHGQGISFQGTDTTFVERLSIQFKENKAFYVANVPGNNVPTLFEIKTISHTGFISENLRHDFPKRIQYDLSNELLTVTISDGGSKKKTFESIREKEQ
jgi:hypothetical protein